MTRIFLDRHAHTYTPIIGRLHSKLTTNSNGSDTLRVYDHLHTIVSFFFGEVSNGYIYWSITGILLAGL